MDLSQLPEGWSYHKDSNTVECSCMFRFGAEHMEWDGADTCPACAEMNIDTTLAAAVKAERERCAKIVHNHQIAFASDACGWALDKIKDGLPPDAIR
jgi:hypothetical protein